MNLFNGKTINNISWLLLGKIFHAILSFVIGLLTARFLGPSNYGLINYATAYTTFFTSFCTLGINAVIIKNFIDNPHEEGQTIGTTLILRLLSSFLSLCTIFGLVCIIDHNEPITISVVTLYSLSLLFQVFDTFNYWFQCKLMSKYYAIATLVSYTIASLYRFFLLAFGKSVQWFAIANTLDCFILALLLFIFYKKKQGPKLSFSLKKSKELLNASLSYILSGLMIAIYGATDKVMIKQMLNETSVGYYSLALSISTMWVFFLSAIIDSLKPTIMKYHNEDMGLFENANKKLYAIVFYISVAAALCITAIAPLFISIVYGQEYLPATSTLRIIVWYVAFSYLGVARDTWVVCEKKQKHLKYLYAGAALLNIVLNLLLIPLLGANGAAIATLLTQMSTIFLFPLFIKDFRPNTRLILDAILLKGVFQTNKNS